MCSHVVSSLLEAVWLYSILSQFHHKLYFILVCISFSPKSSRRNPEPVSKKKIPWSHDKDPISRLSCSWRGWSGREQLSDMKQSELRENNHSPGNNGGVFCGTVWRAQSPTWGPWNQRLVIKASPPAVVLKTPAVVWRALLKMLAFLHHCVFLWAMWTCSNTQTPEPATGESTSDNSITSQVTGGAKRFMPVNKMWFKIYRLQFGKILQMCFFFFFTHSINFHMNLFFWMHMYKNVSLESHGPCIKKWTKLWPLQDLEGGWAAGQVKWINSFDLTWHPQY